MRALALILIFMILLSPNPPALAHSIKPDTYSMELNENAVRVSIDLRFYQNMTGFTLTNRTVWYNATGTAPTFNGTLSSAEIQNVTVALRDAIQALSKNATVSDLEFSVVVSAKWVNLTAEFTVGGTVTLKGDIRKTDFAWKSFQLSRDLAAGNVSFNLYSRKYLRPLVSEIVNQTRSSPSNFTFITSTFFLNNQSVSGQFALDRVGNTTVLDFSALSGTVSLWKRKYFLENHTTIWTFEPGKALDLNIRTQTAPGNATYHFVADFGYNVSLTVPGLAIAESDLIIVESGSGYRELAMVAILIALFVAAVYVSIAYRYRSRRVGKRR